MQHPMQSYAGGQHRSGHTADSQIDQYSEGEAIGKFLVSPPQEDAHFRAHY